jgi:hypothetical protein
VANKRTAEAVAARATESEPRMPSAPQPPRLGVVLTEHAHVVARAEAAATRIARGISAANARGDLQFFNSEYKRRRAQAVTAGRAFMTYGQARARLQKAIAAGGPHGALTPELIEGVLR